MATERIRFARADDRHRATLELAGAFFDENGKGVAGFKDRRELDLEESTLERARAEGIAFSTRTELEPGRYQVRVAVLVGEERLGTATRWLEVPDLSRRELALSDLFLTTAARPAPHPIPDGQRFPRDGAFEFLLFTDRIARQSAERRLRFVVD